MIGESKPGKVAESCYLPRMWKMSLISEVRQSRRLTGWLHHEEGRPCRSQRLEVLDGHVVEEGLDVGRHGAQPEVRRHSCCSCGSTAAS